MEDFVMLHKSIIDDWKFQDEGVLKFWILLLIEETEAVKDKEGVFEINNLTNFSKRARTTRFKAHHILKKMKTKGDIVFSPGWFKVKDNFSIMNKEKNINIGIVRKQTNPPDLQKPARFPSRSVTGNEGAEADFTHKKPHDMPHDNRAPEPMFPSEPEDVEYFEYENGISQEYLQKPARFPSLSVTGNEGAEADFTHKKPHDMPHDNRAPEPMFPSEPEDVEYFEYENGISQEYLQKPARFPSRSVTSNDEAEDDFTYEKPHDSTHDNEPEIKRPRTKDEEERILRRHALRTALKIEVGYLKDDETVNSFFNQLAKEYNGCADKETQLAVRANFLRKIYGSFEDTLEIKKAELYSKHKHNPYVLDPTTKKLCEDLLDPEFLEISKREVFQYDEQKMIKIDVRGPRKVGDIANELVNKLTSQKSARFPSRFKTSDDAIKPELSSKNPHDRAHDNQDSAMSTESNPSNHVGAELALKSINEVNTILNTNIKNISTSTVQENKLSTVQEYIFFKGGYRGEKNQEGFVAENPTENSPTKKNETKTLKVAENHPDGRPVFSSKAFKSLPRAKQIQIIGERLNDFAELFPTVDVEFQFDHWKDWMDAKGQTFKDYSAAFRNWLRKSLDLAAKSNSGTPAKIYTETGAKFVTQEVFTNPAHVPFKKEAPRNPNLKRRPGIGGSE